MCVNFCVPVSYTHLDKHRQHHEDEHAVKPGPNPTDNDFTELDVEQRHKTPERRERIVHGVDRAAGGVGGHRGEQGGIEDAEAHFLSLHVAPGGHDAQVLMNGIATRLGPPTEKNAGQE